jgi:23S rRNA (guanosine2251-2'-O)-methyltransferase
MVALLYNIRSLYNVGSIFRTADAAGFKKIYLCGITPTPLDKFGNKRKDLAKVALRAEDYLSWKKIGSSSSPQATISLIKKLKREGFLICAVEQDKKSVLLNKFRNKNEKIALIVGDEVRGLPKSILKNSDYILEIPMRGRKESLNVSVAFGIVAYAAQQSIK